MLTPEIKLQIAEIWVAGARTPRVLLRRLAVCEKEDVDEPLPYTVDEVLVYISSDEFNQVVLEAERDHIETAVNYVKRRLMRYMYEMDKLAMQDADKRVKAQMLIDLANRGGTAPAQKVACRACHSTAR